MAGSVLILGAGAMAQAMARALTGVAGPTHAMIGDVLVWARRPAEAEALAQLVGARALGDLAEIGSLDLEAVLFCVSDGAIADMALRFAGAWSENAGGHAPIALHTSGYHGVEVLSSLAAFGFERGVLHPVASVNREASNAFDGVHFGVSGDGEVLGFVHDLVFALGGVALDVPTESRPLYHAAAALLSGGMVALFAEAMSSMQAALPGATPQQLRSMCLVLAKTTVNNLETKPAKDALTGPVARGDRAVVEGHLNSFESGECPQRAALYRELVAAMERLLA